MSRYPALVAAVADRDIDELAAASGVPVDDIVGCLEGWVAPLGIRPRLASALDADPVELFRLDDDAEPGMASRPTRYVNDPATLRIIDRLP